MPCYARPIVHHHGEHAIRIQLLGLVGQLLHGGFGGGQVAARPLHLGLARAGVDHAHTVARPARQCAGGRVRLVGPLELAGRTQAEPVAHVRVEREVEMHGGIDMPRDRRVDVTRLRHEAPLLEELAEREHARQQRLRIGLLQRDDRVDDGAERRAHLVVAPKRGCGLARRAMRRVVRRCELRAERNPLIEQSEGQ